MYRQKLYRQAPKWRKRGLPKWEILIPHFGLNLALQRTGVIIYDHILCPMWDETSVKQHSAVLHQYELNRQLHLMREREFNSQFWNRILGIKYQADPMTPPPPPLPKERIGGAIHGKLPWIKKK